MVNLMSLKYISLARIGRYDQCRLMFRGIQTQFSRWCVPSTALSSGEAAIAQTPFSFQFLIRFTVKCLQRADALHDHANFGRYCLIVSSTLSRLCSSCFPSSMPALLSEF